MSFSLFFQSLINGLNQGAIYALIALGYTMVYGIIRMINFAHGDFIMIGAYTLFYTIPLMVNAGMPAWLAVIVAIAVCAVVGVLVETFAYRPVRKAGPMSALITALVVALSVASLTVVIVAGAKDRRCRSYGICAAVALGMMLVGAVGMKLIPAAYFGVVERFSVFAATGFNAALGIHLFCMQDEQKKPEGERT